MKKRVTVTMEFEVELDKEKFNNEEFKKEFNEMIFPTDSIDDHFKHIAQLEARGLIGWDNFVEGYGDLKEYGVIIKQTYQDEEVEEIE